jgi:hypothetical protein
MAQLMFAGYSPSTIRSIGACISTGSGVIDTFSLELDALFTIRMLLITLCFPGTACETTTSNVASIVGI